MNRLVSKDYWILQRLLEQEIIKKETDRNLAENPKLKKVLDSNINELSNLLVKLEEMEKGV